MNFRTRRIGFTWLPQLFGLLMVSWLGVQLLEQLGGRQADRVYPNRAIELVVPFSAGGGTDTFARIIKKGIEDNGLLPQPLVIINQGGAGATIGSRRVKDASPDGYTVLLLHDAVLTAKYHGTVDYGPEAFEPIAGTGEVGMVIAVREDSPYMTLDDLMRDAAARPDVVTFGANLGALTHFAGLQLERLYDEKTKDAAQPTQARFRFAQIGGGADRFADLKGGHIDVTGFSIEEFARFRSEGLRGLAYFGERRHEAAPAVATAIEQGYDVISTNTFYWWFPQGTPQSCIEVMANALEQAMQTPYVERRMAAIHCDPLFVRGAALQARIDRSARHLGRVVSQKTSPLPDLPFWLGAIVGLLAVMIVAGSRLGKQSADQPVARFRLTGPESARAVACLVLTAAYTAALSSGRIDFRLATTAFVFLCGSLLFRGRPYALMIVAVLSGFGVYSVFTQFFVIDLSQM